MDIHSACNKVWVMIRQTLDDQGYCEISKQDTSKSSDTSPPIFNAVINPTLSHRRDFVHNPLLFLEVVGLADLLNARSVEESSFVC